MSDPATLQDLYRRTVLDHSRHPRHFERMSAPDRQAEGHNPLCGDKITVYLRLADDSVEAVSFEAAGCAISLASASIMSEQVPGLSLAAAGERAAAVAEALAPGADDAALGELGELQALAGVRAYPSRIRCALLPWRTLAAALQQDAATVTTEPTGS